VKEANARSWQAFQRVGFLRLADGVHDSVATARLVLKS
jgi:hypothetical protein